MNPMNTEKKAASVSGGVVDPSLIKRSPSDFLFPRRYFGVRVKGFQPIPAYFYHQAEVEEIAKVCEQIARKRIRTLTFEDILDGHPVDEKAVLLTVDDWWSSTWSIIFPLARKYGLRFTLFLSPESVEDTDECRPTLDDGVDPEELVARDLGPRFALTWGEVRKMHQSGIVDVQSHSLNHGVVFASDRFREFSTTAGPFPIAGAVPLVTRVDGGDVAQRRPELGTPLYEWGPALATSRRFIADPIVNENCIRVVRENGGKEFFLQNGWKERLSATLGKSGAGNWESDEQRQARFRTDLLSSKLEIEGQLIGSKVRVFAPPWGAFHRDLPTMAHDIGYQLLVTAYPSPRRSTGSPIPLYPRLFGEAIWTFMQGPLRGGVNCLAMRRRHIERARQGAIP